LFLFLLARSFARHCHFVHASIALALGVVSPSLEAGASSSGKFQGSEGGVVDTPGPDQGRVLFAEDDETKVELF
jgi:hypothetical protein